MPKSHFRALLHLFPTATNPFWLTSGEVTA